MKFATKAIHAGVSPDPSTGAIMTPIYQTTTYVQDGLGVHKGYAYSRSANPTRTALEANLAALENAKYGACFSSGLAAMDCLLKMLKPGDEVVCTQDLYGGSYRLFNTVFKRYGILFHYTPMDEVSTVDSYINKHTRMIWVETPTNPMMRVVDIAAISKLARSAKALLAVDNTFASPYLQNPIDLGADVVMHSVTKYLGGHSDVVMGALATNDEQLAAEIYRIQNASGAICGPQDAFLALRGIKTLHLRMERHSENGMKIAEWLQNQSNINEVFYPGLPGHPGHEVAKRQMRGFTGMVSFNLKNDRLEAAREVLQKVRLFSLAESLGGVESLIGHPATMTHAGIPVEQRKKAGITDSLIRLSVGIEDATDLIEDLDQALNHR